MESDHSALRGDQVEEVSGTRQLRALMYKNATIQKRQTKTLICQCMIPFILIVILAVLQIEITKVLDENLPAPGTIQIKSSKYVPFTKHTPGSKWNSSYAVVYDDQNATVGYLLEDKNGSGLLGNIPQFRTRYSESHNTPHLIRPIFTYYYSPEELYDNYTIAKDEAIALGNGTASKCPACPVACFYFNDVIIQESLSDSEPADLVLDYTIVLDTQLNAFYATNRSTAINMMDSAFLKDVYNEIYVPWFGSDFLSNDPAITTWTRPMPFVIGQFVTDVASFFGIFLLPFCLTFLLPVFMYMVVMEKEEKLRSMMLMMGLRMRWYWLVTYLFNYMLHICICLIVVITSVAFNLRIFTQTEPMILFLMLFLWGFALNSLSIFLSAFFSSSRTATIVGYMLVIASVIVSNTINITTNYESLPNPIFLLYPPFAFFRIIFIIGLYCGIDQCPVWGYNSDHIPTLLFFLFLDSILYLVAGLYLDAVLPSQWGVPRHPLFPFYALRDMIFGEQQVEVIGDGVTLIDNNTKTYDNQQPANPEKDQMVLEEQHLIQSLFENTSAAAVGDEHEKARVMSAVQRGLLVHNLKKTYDNGKEAVKGVSFAAPEGQCFGLLGPNGAGKTTTISMLTGLFPPSCGRARVGGFELETELDKVHRVMGVCPQFDILWRAMTVRETLLFYTRLKGIPTSEEKQSVEDSLDSVGLGEFADRPVKELSGGMKRRVSLAVSLCGNARVVFLDEPTTGLDPVTRRDLWDTLLTMKKQNRCLILTTHSMEEADVLCDRIGIMTMGELSCLGTSLQLKNKYGSGYVFQVQHSLEKEEEAKNFITAHFPSAILKDFFPGHLIYSLSQDSFLVSQLFRIMNTEGQENGVVDWGLSQTSLEDVFLNVAETDETFED